MIRFGITKLEQLASELPRSDRRRPLSYALLGDFNENLSAQDEDIIASICDSIPTGRHLENRGRTFPNRYGPVDELIAEEIVNTFPSDHLVRIHDVAASNAITSAELFQRLSDRGNVSVHATDFLNQIYVVSVPFSTWRTIFDAEKRPLQFLADRFVISASGREHHRFIVNWMLQKYLMRRILPSARRILNQNAASDLGHVQTISVFHPKSIALGRKDPRFTLGRYDMFGPMSQTYDVIRVMSAFGFIGADQVEQTAHMMCTGLVDSGLFVVGRNSGRETREIPTTIFKRRGRRLIPVRDYCGGFVDRELLSKIELTT